MRGIHIASNVDPMIYDMYLDTSNMLKEKKCIAVN